MGHSDENPSLKHYFSESKKFDKKQGAISNYKKLINDIALKNSVPSFYFVIG